MKTFCPFCKESLFSYDEYGDLWLCTYKHYQIYYYGSKTIDDLPEYQEQIVFDGFCLAIEQPENIYQLKVVVSDTQTMIYDLNSFPIGDDHQALKDKLESYITFI